MDIIKQRQEERESKISRIVELLNKMKNSEIVFSHREFIVQAMDVFKLSRRYTVDYVDVALNRMNLKRGDIFK